LAFDADSNTLITGGYDGRLMWWSVDAAAPQPLRTIDAHQGFIRAVAVSPDGTLVASAGNDLVVRLWNREDGGLVRELGGHESHVYNVAFHPSGGRLVSGDLKCNLIDWDVATGKQLRTWQAEALIKYDEGFRADIGGFPGMTFSHDGKQLAVSGITEVTNAFAGIGNPLVVVFDWERGEKVAAQGSKGKLQGVAWGVVLHPEGITIAASGGPSGGYLLFWRPGEANEFHEVNLKNTARDLALSPDGMHVATAHHDSHLRISRLGE
jgi:WD40 repeat protein